MYKKQLKKHLLARRDVLSDRISRLKENMTRKNSADWSEQAQERENDEVVDALGNEATMEFNLINKALERIANDEYGYCSMCGTAIAKGRLQAMPYTDACIRCAEARDA